MITLNTFQKYILKLYVLPIFLISFIFSLILTYQIGKFFRFGITTKQQRQTTQIKRRNITINNKHFKNWTILEEDEKNEILNKYDIKTLENLDNFKIIKKNINEDVEINDDNISEYYNFIIFIKTLVLKFKFGFIMIFGLPFIPLYFFYKKYYLTNLKELEKFINLPFFLSSLNSSFNEEKTKKLIDKFIKYDKENKFYLYKTNSITQKLVYEKNKTEIENYLNLQNLKIIQNDLIIKIEERKIDKIVNFDKNDYKENKLYLGKREHSKKIYLDILGLKHTIIIGESGSGKSVFLQNILLSIFKNLNLYENIFLVDFKMVEMSRYENKNEKIKVISGIKEFTQKVKEIENIMWNRYHYMKQNKLTNFDGKSILVFIDEFRSLENNSLEKEEKKEMIKSLIELLQKRRRRKIFLIFRGQKRDTQNINSSIISNIMNRIILKTTSNDNITKIRGNQEELERNGISINEIKNFNRGRLYYKDGDSGENFLIQSPYFNIEDKNQSDFMFSLISKNEEETEKTIILQYFR